jgi:hypothetical protein
MLLDLDFKSYLILFLYQLKPIDLMYRFQIEILLADFKKPT